MPYYNIMNKSTLISMTDKMSKRMYGTMRELLVMEILEIISIHLGDELKEHNKVTIPGIGVLKLITKTIPWTGKTKKYITIYLEKELEKILHQRPLYRSDRIENIIQLRKEKNRINFQAYQDRFLTQLLEKREQWLNERRSRQIPLDGHQEKWQDS